MNMKVAAFFITLFGLSAIAEGSQNIVKPVSAKVDVLNIAAGNLLVQISGGLGNSPAALKGEIGLNFSLPDVANIKVEEAISSQDRPVDNSVVSLRSGAWPQPIHAGVQANGQRLRSQPTLAAIQNSARSGSASPAPLLSHLYDNAASLPQAQNEHAPLQIRSAPLSTGRMALQRYQGHGANAVLSAFFVPLLGHAPLAENPGGWEYFLRLLIQTGAVAVICFLSVLILDSLRKRAENKAEAEFVRRRYMTIPGVVDVEHYIYNTGINKGSMEEPFDLIVTNTTVYFESKEAYRQALDQGLFRESNEEYAEVRGLVRDNPSSG